MDLEVQPEFLFKYMD